MPFDQKKINGPEISFSYRLYTGKAEEESSKNLKTRDDGRSADENREMGKFQCKIL